MKPKRSTLVPNLVMLVVGLAILINRAPPPPAGVDFLFVVGWYVGHYVGVIENLFR